MNASSRLTARASGAILACVILLGAFAVAARAEDATTATLAPSLHPNRLGALSALTMTVSYEGGELGVPEPVRRAVLDFPVGLSIEIPDLLSCPPERLRKLGPRGCPPHSQIGSGHALAEVQAGSQLITENVALSVFLGAPRNLQPTVEILGQGYTPFDERLMFTGTVEPGHAPYGEELVMSVPAIPSLPLEPDASILSLSLTVGAAHRGHATSSVVVPRGCPAGGFPFAAEFTYADGSVDKALATAPCPT
jgi:hypothetical protein